MACNLVTNFEVALIKKLWQCSCNRTLPFPPTLGEGYGYVGYLGIPAIFQLVCHTFLSITFAFICYSRSVEARNCRSDRRETGTQIDQIGKTGNHVEYEIRKPVNIFHENQKPNEHQNRKTDLKCSQNRKTKNPNASLLNCLSRCRPTNLESGPGNALMRFICSSSNTICSDKNKRYTKNCLRI